MLAQNLKNKKIKKRFIFIAIALIFFLAITITCYNLFYKNNELIVLVPIDRPYKIKPDIDLKSPSDSDKTNYDDMQISKNSIQKKVSLAPEPEQPLENLSKIIVEAPKDDIDIFTQLEDSVNLQKADEDLSLWKEILDNSFDENEKNFLKGISPDEKHDIISSSVKNLKVTIIDEEDKLKDKKINKTSFYRSMLAYKRTKDEAEAEWRYIANKHKKILTDINYEIKLSKTNNNSFSYLVLAGKFKSFKEAKLLCKKLISKKQNCIVVNK